MNDDKGSGQLKATKMVKRECRASIRAGIIGLLLDLLNNNG